MSAWQENTLIKMFLFPLSLVYGLIMDCRNFLYDTGFFRQEKFSVPVISVGNLSAGGTGKTPFIMLLLELLKDHFSTIAVVSRGYGRKSKGSRIVSDGADILISVEESGDEPMLIARRYPGVPVIVSEERRKGIQEAVRKFNASLILLDDAFQHRRVARDCDIVLINTNNQITRDRVLPLGRLRERPKHLRRANIIVYTESIDRAQDDLSVEKFAGVSDNSFNCIFKADCVVDANLEEAGGLEQLRGKRCVAFAAIANPAHFYANLQQLQIQVEEFLPFKDHHYFNRKDYILLNAAIKKNNSEYLITTEKDLVKVDSSFLSTAKLVGIRRRGVLIDSKKFRNKLQAFVDFKM